ncbi:hypothetical protein Tco_1109955 [Tanacetum coccineum]|uniref:Uncharacterized protein n=1 Tax=Tanacetum coccineum TaxID=301880 RepID=A0ABQ5IHD9_9ASTR
MKNATTLLTDKVMNAILQYNVSKPLPLGGEPGHITIQSDFFFNKDLEYLRYGRKIGIPALSISKMKAAFYPDVGLEQLDPSYGGNWETTTIPWSQFTAPCSDPLNVVTQKDL